ncbi:MAG: 50S ribosomal protein L29 [Candidatus Omnitrophota bacterium]
MTVQKLKTKELRGLSREELLQKAKTLKEELFKLNLARYAARVEKPHMFSLIKRDIARINTILNEKKETARPKEAGLK